MAAELIYAFRVMRLPLLDAGGAPIGRLEDVDLGARVGLRWQRGPFEMMNAITPTRATWNGHNSFAPLCDQRTAGRERRRHERGGPRLEAARARLARFNLREKRLRRAYADVLSAAEAGPQIELVEHTLSQAKAQLRAATRGKRTD